MRRRALGGMVGVLTSILATTALSHDVRAGAAAQQRGGATPPTARTRAVVVRHHAGEPAGLRALAPGLAVGRLTDGDLARLVREEGADAVRLPEVRLMTDVALPIIGVPIVETAGLTGAGTVVGVVDSGFDVTHPALRDPAGRTRLTWLLDFSKRTRGKHPDLETRFAIQECAARAADGSAADGGSCDADPRCATTAFPCAVTHGAVYAGADLDALLTALPTPPEPIPTDEVGHGTHAMAIAAGTNLVPTTPYRGVATGAQLVGVKGDGSGLSISTDAVLAGIAFIFDRADDAKLPAAVNLSLAADFTTRDGSDPLGPAVAALTGAPGHVIVAAAGNSGDPALASHQSVSVANGETVRVKLFASPTTAAVPEMDVIVSPHPGANVEIGCDTPDGVWVDPIPRGRTRSGTIDGAIANVIFNPPDFLGRIPGSSSSAYVEMLGALSSTAPYAITLHGSGTVDLWVSGGSFENGVREQTVGSPAMHPSVIAVGASLARTGYRTRAGEDLVLRDAIYDVGGLVRIGETDSAPPPGAIGSFSGAGPGPGGIVKPDLVAPGIIIVSAASSARDGKTSIFEGNAFCPARADGANSTDPLCAFVDNEHAVGTGTSFAAPFVTGAAAILLQVDPTLDQEQMRVALQAGVHAHRSAPRFLESASPGELDIPGSVAVVKRLRKAPAFVAPSRDHSWITPNSHYAPADGTRPLEVLFHLHGEDGTPADGFDVDRFATFLVVDGATSKPQHLARLAPGEWTATFQVPGDRAPAPLEIIAAFDGTVIADPVTIPIAFDPWQARYAPPTSRGASCSAAPGARDGSASLPIILVLLVALFVRGRSCPASPECTRRHGSGRYRSS